MLGCSLVEYLSKSSEYTVIALSRDECDLLDSSQVNSFILKNRPDYIIHTAAKVFGIGGNKKFNWESIRDNTLINYNIISASKLIDLEKFIAIGTGAIYPSDLPSPLKETDIYNGRPHDSEYGYAQAKRHMLSMLETLKSEKDFEWSYIVSCNLYGPNDNFNIEYGHVIPSLIHKFYLGKKNATEVEIWGDGSAIRDFLHVKDASRMIIDIMKKISGPINIGSNNKSSIKDIVTNISNTFSYTDYHYNSNLPNGAKQRYYDLSKIEQLDFEYEFDINNGIKHTCDWFCDNYSNIRK